MIYIFFFSRKKLEDINRNDNFVNSWKIRESLVEEILNGNLELQAFKKIGSNQRIIFTITIYSKSEWKV